MLDSPPTTICQPAHYDGQMRCRGPSIQVTKPAGSPLCENSVSLIVQYGCTSSSAAGLTRDHVAWHHTSNRLTRCRCLPSNTNFKNAWSLYKRDFQGSSRLLACYSTVRLKARCPIDSVDYSAHADRKSYMQSAERQTAVAVTRQRTWFENLPIPPKSKHICLTCGGVRVNG